MKRLILLVALILMLSSLPVVVASDTDTSATDSSISGNEITIRKAQASNSSASGAIRITMYAVGNE